MAEPFFALSGFDAQASRNAHEAGRPQVFAVPSLLRSLLTDHLDPGYAAAAERTRNGAGSGRAATWAWEALAALLVAAVFAVAVAQARSMAPGVRTAQQVLAGNVRAAGAATDALVEQRNTLSARVDELRRQRLTDDAAGQRLLAGLDALSLAAASGAVTGPGLRITVTEPGVGRNLSDASKQRVSGSQQIILDRDLQLVVNSLWAAGAEAIAIGDVRIGPNVTIRQAGGAILADNNPLSSPYTIRAIGPPTELRDGFGRSLGLERLRLLEISYGVVVHVDTDTGPHDLTLPAGATRAVRFAEPMEE
ncbi:DUF881 domain-containing protein [Mycobacterium sp. M1]|uniref:DUF881 domain-containing protein n=1 Tax=Mycolicibacter acidiphilus TaxID=2835306 RepID=A0ABS5RER1_9MYCO|nr:DUF881 domain-containing protein [Mycolicibacter acidiphilus]MBS9532679.1 DUF881 domain-containing protein [Mycolicibacter acidiphilus]